MLSIVWSIYFVRASLHGDGGPQLRSWTKQMENLEPPSPQIKDGKMARFWPSRAFILDLGGGGGGGGGLLFHFILSKIAILDKINGKPRPPLPPKSRMGKWRVFALHAPSSLIWGEWGFAVPFYFVQDCRWRNPLWWGNPPVHKISHFNLITFTW